MLVALAAVAASATATGAAARPAAAQAQGEPASVEYDPPVDAPIIDGFRPPPQPWLPGNRGVEYATTPGTPVRAAGRGVVSFAGPVAGSLHVTVAHPDGVRTSYSYLASMAVVAGDLIERGAVVGTSGPRLHVGARRGDTYIDPESLWGQRGPPWVRLVPLDGGDPGGRSGPGGRGRARASPAPEARASPPAGRSTTLPLRRWGSTVPQ